MARPGGGGSGGRAGGTPGGIPGGGRSVEGGSFRGPINFGSRGLAKFNVSSVPQISSGVESRGNIGATRVPGLEAKLPAPLKRISLPGDSGSQEGPTVQANGRSRYQVVSIIPREPTRNTGLDALINSRRFIPSVSQANEGLGGAQRTPAALIFPGTPQTERVTPENAQAANEQPVRQLVTPTLNSLAVQASRAALLEGNPGKERPKVKKKKKAPKIYDEPVLNPRRFAPKERDIPSSTGTEAQQIAKIQQTFEMIRILQDRQAGKLISQIQKDKTSTESLQADQNFIPNPYFLQDELMDLARKQGKTSKTGAEARRMLLERQARIARAEIERKKIYKDAGTVEVSQLRIWSFNGDNANPKWNILHVITDAKFIRDFNAHLRGNIDPTMWRKFLALTAVAAKTGKDEAFVVDEVSEKEKRKKKAFRRLLEPVRVLEPKLLDPAEDPANAPVRVVQLKADAQPITAPDRRTNVLPNSHTQTLPATDRQADVFPFERDRHDRPAREIPIFELKNKGQHAKEQNEEKVPLLQRIGQRIKVIFKVDESAQTARRITALQAIEANANPDGTINGEPVAAALGKQKGSSLISGLLKTLDFLAETVNENVSKVDGSLVKLQVRIAHIKGLKKKEMNTVVFEQTEMDPAVEAGKEDSGGRKVTDREVQTVVNGASIPVPIAA